MRPDEEVQQALEEVIAEATTRPISDDEANLLAFWCSVRYVKPIHPEARNA